MDTIPQDSMPRKQCSNPDCLQWFPATTEFFHYNKQNKDGLCGYCKACKRAYVAAYRKSPEGHAHIQAYRSSPEGQAKTRASEKAYRQRPEVREQNRIRDRERHKTPERQAWTQEYKSRPEVQARTQEYMQAYRPVWGKAYRSRPEVQEQARIHSHNHRSRKKVVGGTHTPEQLQDLLKRQKHKCYYCSARFQKVKGKYLYHVDHTFPLSRANGDDLVNDISYLVLACPKCNRSKSDKFPWEWPEGGRLL